jgi:hypothetical protein
MQLTTAPPTWPEPMPDKFMRKEMNVVDALNIAMQSREKLNALAKLPRLPWNSNLTPPSQSQQTCNDIWYKFDEHIMG